MLAETHPYWMLYNRDSYHHVPLHPRYSFVSFISLTDLNTGCYYLMTDLSTSCYYFMADFNTGAHPRLLLSSFNCSCIFRGAPLGHNPFGLHFLYMESAAPAW